MIHFVEVVNTEGEEFPITTAAMQLRVFLSSVIVAAWSGCGLHDVTLSWRVGIA